MQRDISHIYHINTKLKGDSLDITVWTDDNLQNQWKKIVSVTELENQRTYGVISSGAAIQWKQTSPKQTVTINTQARPPIQKITEIQREQQSKIKVEQLMKPSFGKMKLESISKQSILFGQYLYKTQDTNLKKIHPKNGTDYVLFATDSHGVVTDFGTAPKTIGSKHGPNIIVSVITGNAYDEQGNVVAHAGNLWKIYQQEHGPFSSSINTYIKSTQEALFAGLSKINFGEFKLDIISQNALINGHFVYESKQTIEMKDTQGNIIPDYLIMAEIHNNELGHSIGMSPASPNAQGLLSLVTGNLYNKTSTFIQGKTPKPIATGYMKLYAYENQFSKIASQELEKIKSSQTIYRAQLIAAKKRTIAKQAPKIIIVSSTPVSSNNVSQPTKGISLGSPTNIPLGSPSQGNISNLQKNASGSAGFQLGTP